MKNVFNQSDAQEFKDRINQLTAETQPQWGKMNVAQMLAHCNVSYEMVYTDKHPPATGFKKFILKALVKNVVVGDKPYKKNGRTAPQFLIVDERVFEDEKKRLLDHITQTQELGEEHFEGMESNSFGPLNKTEWNNMFSKHLEHHLGQFGV